MKKDQGNILSFFSSIFDLYYFFFLLVTCTVLGLLNCLAYLIHLVLVVESQCSDFAVVWIGVLLGDILQSPVCYVGIDRNLREIMPGVTFGQHILCNFPETHRTIPGT